MEASRHRPSGLGWSASRSISSSSWRWSCCAVRRSAPAVPAFAFDRERHRQDHHAGRRQSWSFFGPGADHLDDYARRSPGTARAYNRRGGTARGARGDGQPARGGRAMVGRPGPNREERVRSQMRAPGERRPALWLSHRAGRASRSAHQPAAGPPILLTRDRHPRRGAARRSGGGVRHRWIRARSQPRACGTRCAKCLPTLREHARCRPPVTFLKDEKQVV